MSDVLIVVQREFLERVRSRSFLIGTLLFPAVMIGIYALPLLVGAGGGGERTLAVVDEGPPGVAESFAALLTAPPAKADATRYRVEPVPGPLAEAREELIRRVQEKEIDGYVVVPPDIVEGGRVAYRARNIANMGVLKDLERAASASVQAVRLRRAGLEAGDVFGLLRPVGVQSARITDRGEEGASAGSTVVFAYVVAVLMLFLTVFYGVTVMRSVLEEKTNRIAEVIVSSMKASHLMAGKIVGVGAVALAQVSVWAAILALVATQSELVTDRLGLPAGALKALRIDPWVGAAFVAFFILGFFIYASLFAALGAAVTTEQEAQSFLFFVQLPAIVPMLLLVPITNEPLGPVATVLGLVPLTAPIAMPMRMSATDIPLAQVLGSMALMLLALGMIAWLAGKIYRVGILSTGKRPTLRDLGRWLKAA